MRTLARGTQESETKGAAIDMICVFEFRLGAELEHTAFNFEAAKTLLLCHQVLCREFTAVDGEKQYILTHYLWYSEERNNLVSSDGAATPTS